MAVTCPHFCGWPSALLRLVNQEIETTERLMKKHLIPYMLLPLLSHAQ